MEFVIKLNGFACPPYLVGSAPAGGAIGRPRFTAGCWPAACAASNDLRARQVGGAVAMLSAQGRPHLTPLSPRRRAARRPRLDHARLGANVTGRPEAPAEAASSLPCPPPLTTWPDPLGQPGLRGPPAPPGRSRRAPERRHEHRAEPAVWPRRRCGSAGPPRHPRRCHIRARAAALTSRVPSAPGPPGRSGEPPLFLRHRPSEGGA